MKSRVIVAALGLVAVFVFVFGSVGCGGGPVQAETVAGVTGARDGEMVRAAAVTPTPSPTSSPTVAPTATVTATPSPTTPSLWPPSVQGTRNPDVFKSVQAAPCTVSGAGGVVHEVVVVDGANRGVGQATVWAVWWGADKVMTGYGQVGVFGQGWHSVTGTMPAGPRSVWVQMVAQVQGVVYLADICSVQ